MATDNREKVEIPQIHHISNFIGKRVKARIPPRFWGRISKAKFSKIGEESILIRGVPEKNPSVLSIRANTELKRSNPGGLYRWGERIKHAMENRLCFSCLVRGHLTRECRSKKKCGKNGYTKMHHLILHADPPPVAANSKMELHLFRTTEALYQWYAWNSKAKMDESEKLTSSLIAALVLQSYERILPEPLVHKKTWTRRLRKLGAIPNEEQCRRKELLN